MAYLAPEMLKRTGHNKAVDWYLLGVLIFEMITGTPPHFNRDRNAMFNSIEKGEIYYPPIIGP